MSQQEFQATITNADDEGIKRALDNLCKDSESSIGLDVNANKAELIIEASISVAFEYFEDIYEKLSTAGAEFEMCKLFESATGGTHIFESSLDLDIDFDDKTVCVLGFDESDIEEMSDILDESEITEEFSSDVDIVVYSDSVLEEQVEEFKTKCSVVIGEDHFWECINSEPC